MHRSRSATIILAAVVLVLLAGTPVAAQTSTSRPSSTSSSTTSSIDRGTGRSTTTTDAAPDTPETPAPNRRRPDEVPRAPIPIDDDPRVAPELAYVIVDGSDYSRAVDAFRATEDRLRQAEDAIHVAEDGIQEAQGRIDRAVDDYNKTVAQLADLLQAVPRLEGQINQATRRKAKSEKKVADVRLHLRDLAVDQYVKGGLGGPPEGQLSLSKVNEEGSRRILVDTVQRDRLIELRTNLEVIQDQATLITNAQNELAQVRQRIATTERRRDQFDADRQQGERERTDAIANRDRKVSDRDSVIDDLKDRKKDIADARLTADVPGLDFPFVVLNAYVRAAGIKAREDPSCGIRWTALAGIGKTESNHGTFGGARVDGDGNIDKPIYGIALDGSNGTASIGDSDGGEIDGDPNGDRAAGPMQFIPSSWRHYGRDANLDGKIDIQNLNDAALAAAGLLCDKGPGLEVDAGLRRAFFSYNPDQRYVSIVLGRVHGYDDFILPWPADTPPAAPTETIPPPPGIAAPTTSTTSTTAPPLGR